MGNLNQTFTLTQELVRIAKQNLIAIGFQKLTVDSTVGGVALTVPATAKYALIVAECTTGIRYLECGNTVYAVTATDGIKRVDGDAFDIQGYQNLIQFRAIQTTAGTNTIHVQYYK